jgi:hypothetical protein
MKWTALQDDVVITADMTDEQVWLRCRLSGFERLATAIEMFITEIEIEITVDKISDPS